jgi:hypothetical protein
VEKKLGNFRWNMVAGGAMVLLAAVFLIWGSRLSFGTLTHMGPGFLPICAAVGLAVLGLLIAIEGLKREPPILDLPKLRPLLVIAACPVLFSQMIEPFGMVPTVVATALLARAAEPIRWGWDLVLVPLGLSLLAVFVFINFLGVAIPAF